MRLWNWYHPRVYNPLRYSVYVHLQQQWVYRSYHHINVNRVGFVMWHSHITLLLSSKTIGCLVFVLRMRLLSVLDGMCWLVVLLHKYRLHEYFCYQFLMQNDVTFVLQIVNFWHGICCHVYIQPWRISVLKCKTIINLIWNV